MRKRNTCMLIILYQWVGSDRGAVAVAVAGAERPPRRPANPSLPQRCRELTVLSALAGCQLPALASPAGHLASSAALSPVFLGPYRTRSLWGGKLISFCLVRTGSAQVRSGIWMRLVHYFLGVCTCVTVCARGRHGVLDSISASDSLCQCHQEDVLPLLLPSSASTRINRWEPSEPYNCPLNYLTSKICALFLLHPAQLFDFSPSMSFCPFWSPIFHSS